MQKINTTDITPIIVEIDGEEFSLASKTIDIADALLTAQEACKGMQQYHLWLAELRVLMGKAAVEKLFPNGSAANIDRIHRIHSGVVRAFEYHAMQTEAQNMQQRSEIVNQMLGFMSDFVEKLEKITAAAE